MGRRFPPAGRVFCRGTVERFAIGWEVGQRKSRKSRKRNQFLSSFVYFAHCAGWFLQNTFHRRLLSSCLRFSGSAAHARRGVVRRGSKGRIIRDHAPACRSGYIAPAGQSHQNTAWFRGGKPRRWEETPAAGSTPNVQLPTPNSQSKQRCACKVRHSAFGIPPLGVRRWMLGVGR